MNTNKKRTWIAAIALTILGFAYIWQNLSPKYLVAVSFDPPLKQMNLEGVNWDGKPFSSESLLGRPILVFFGYASCPDICPITFSLLNRLTKELGVRAPELAVVFVTVDPERDTIGLLAEYVPYFNREFYGIRMDPKQLSAAAKMFDVQYGKSGIRDDQTYFVDHTPYIFGVDRAGKLRLYFSLGQSIEDMLPDVISLMEKLS